MTPKETALILRLHNAWRRGDDETAPNMTPPKLLGEAIDSAIVLIEQRDELLSTLENCAEIFDFYAKHHATKTVPDEEKAKQNYQHRNMCKKAIAGTKGAAP